MKNDGSDLLQKILIIFSFEYRALLIFTIFARKQSNEYIGSCETWAKCVEFGK